VEHSELTGRWSVGAGALVSGVRSLHDLAVQPGTAVQELRVEDADGGGRVVSVLSVRDPIKDAYTKPTARIHGVPWSKLFAVAGVTADDIWPAEVAAAARTIWTARLFPLFQVGARRAGGLSGPADRRGVSEAVIGRLQDRAALWLQYLPQLADDGAAASEAARTHGSPDVLALWRDAERLSLRDILGQADASVEFGWRRSLRGRIDVALLLGAVAQGGNVAVTELVSRLGRGAQTVTSVTDGVGTALDDVAGSHLHLGKSRARTHPGLRRLASTAGGSSDAGPASPGMHGRRGAGREVPGFVGAAAAAPELTWTPQAALSNALSATPGGAAAGSVDVFSFAYAALKGLDDIAAHASTDIAGRALAVQSALLWAMAGWGTVEHRSGPAHNAAWLPAFSLLEGHYALDGGAAAAGGETLAQKRIRAIALLAELRDGWLHRAHLIGRAARHYERASQLLTAQCVYTAHVTPPTPLPASATVPPGTWVMASAPARIDLAGGWSDTPPITYEARALHPATLDAAPAASGSSCIDAIAAFAARGGGLVVNVAVAVDGQQPIGTRSRLVTVATPSEGAGAAAGGTSAPGITIRTRARPAGGAAGGSEGADGAPGVVATTLHVTTLSDLSDYNQPHAEGAIVKCALLCLGLVRLPSTSAFALSSKGADYSTVPPLAEQLTARLGGGLEVETWSLLPHGSGLGGSSILSATVLASLARTVGLVFDLPSLNHLVLLVEQMLSTGGGWQDQVGGMWPGVKASSCTATLPVAVTVQPLSRPGLTPPVMAAQHAHGSGVPGAVTGPAAVDPELSTWLNDHLVLVYTGKTRLAKNLLQRVLRQWAMRENDVTQRVADLRTNAVTMAAGIVARDAAAVGASLSAYWEQKKGMAPMAEPAEVAALIKSLVESGVACGASLTGAGGGGFLVVVTREPKAAAAVARVVAARPGAAEAGLSVHTATVDEMGLVVKV